MMPSVSTPDSRPKQVAKWGAACAPCASAKAKCLRSDDTPGTKCDRCQRLFKDCSRQVHRPRKKRTTKPSKTSQLEDRLNGLVDMLRASGELPHIPRAEDALTYDGAKAEDMFSCIPTKDDVRTSQHNTRPQRRGHGLSPESDDLSEDDFDDASSMASSPEDSHGGRPFTIPASYNSYAPAQCICRPKPGEAPPPPESDESLLSRFRAQMAPNFPFVPIRDAETPESLASTRPFLWQTIKMAGSVHSVRSMRGQLYRIMRYLSDHVLMRSHRSLDLLQGMIVVLGFYHYHCMMHAQMNSVIHLAEAMLADLGLNRNPRLTERTRLMVMHPDEPRPRTNDDRRALLGVWFLSSAIALSFQKTQPMRYSAYVQLCARELEEAKEFETDALLVHLVRVQHLTEKIAALNTREDPSEEIPGMPKAPMSAYQSAFHAELNKIRAGLTKKLRANRILMTAINSAELHLFEPPVIDAELITKLTQTLTSGGGGTGGHGGQPASLDMLYRANATLRMWFDYWFSIPASDYHWFPVTQCAQLIFAVTSLSRWAKIVGPVRPSAVARGTFLGVPIPTDKGDSKGGEDGKVGSSRAGSPDAASGGGPGTGSVPTLNAPSPAKSTITLPERASSTTHLTPPAHLTRPSSPASSSQTTTAAGASSAESSASASAPTKQKAAPAPAYYPFISTMQLRDLETPAAVAALKAQLAAEPTLGLDIPEILAAVGQRLEQAWRQSNEMAAAACAARGGDPATELVFESNVWDLSARKFMITRAKLERWAEIVAGGGAALVSPQSATTTTTTTTGESGEGDDAEGEEEEETQAGVGTATGGGLRVPRGHAAPGHLANLHPNLLPRQHQQQQQQPQPPQYHPQQRQPHQYHAQMSHHHPHQVSGLPPNQQQLPNVPPGFINIHAGMSGVDGCASSNGQLPLGQMGSGSSMDDVVMAGGDAWAMNECVNMGISEWTNNMLWGQGNGDFLQGMDQSGFFQHDSWT